MNCERIREQVDLLLDDDMTMSDIVLKHASSCRECRSYIRSMEALGAGLAQEAGVIHAASGKANADTIIDALPAGGNRRSSGGGILGFVRRHYIAVACAAAVLMALGRIRRERLRRGETSPGNGTLTTEQVEALRILGEARDEMVASLRQSRASVEDAAIGYGRTFIDAPLEGEIDRIEDGVKSFEAFVLDLLPIPEVPTGAETGLQKRRRAPHLGVS